MLVGCASWNLGFFDGYEKKTETGRETDPGQEKRP
jgi:hypothetical protein